MAEFCEQIQELRQADLVRLDDNIWLDIHVDEGRRSRDHHSGRAMLADQRRARAEHRALGTVTGGASISSHKGNLRREEQS